MELCVKWKRQAEKQLEEAILYIQNHSPVSAEKVRHEILLKIDNLLKNPEAYSPDKYKTDNDGSFRALELHHFRISYRIKNKEIRILRIRHTGMNPVPGSPENHLAFTFSLSLNTFSNFSTLGRITNVQ